MSILFLSLVVLFPSLVVAADKAETPFVLTCRDGFKLDATYRHPAKITDETAANVLILLHGSGPQSMDVDLTPVTKDKKKNLLFVELAESLAPAGFTVVRYHKRSYQVRLKAAADANYLKSIGFKAFAKNPLKYFVDDAQDCVRWAGKRFPRANIFLLGHSQGTYVALQVAHVMPEVKGVALIGLYLTSLDNIIYEQTIYRPLRLFRKLDTDRNEKLDAEELKSKDKVAGLLRLQMKVIDLDGDGSLSRTEFMAANFSNLIVRDLLATVRVQEATYPRPADILMATKIRVAFFQGLLDNQTPAYHAKAVELVHQQLTKDKKFHFHFFPGLGHALDPRDDYDDLQFRRISPKAKQAMVKELKAFLIDGVRAEPVEARKPRGRR